MRAAASSTSTGRASPLQNSNRPNTVDAHHLRPDKKQEHVAQAKQKELRADLLVQWAVCVTRPAQYCPEEQVMAKEPK